MSTEDQDRSVELAKASLEHSQACVTHVDTKVGVTVGLLVFLLPAPLVAVGWFSGLEHDAAKWVFSAFIASPYWTALSLAALLSGMVCAGIALFFGMETLSPRTPSGYDKSELPFHNQWQPNILFPIHKPDQTQRAAKHFDQLDKGADFTFFIGEYKHQMIQFGRILENKITAMKLCFRWLGRAVICYALAILLIALIAVVHLCANNNSTGRTTTAKLVKPALTRAH